MFIHYLTMALLNMRRTAFASVAGILCLAIGFFTMVAVVGVVAFWRSADHGVLPKDGRAVAITETVYGGSIHYVDVLGTGQGLAPFMRQDIPELKTVGRLVGRGQVSAANGNVSTTLWGANADAGFLQIFHFHFLEGRAETALQRGDGIVLTQESAHKLFGAQPAMGGHILLGGVRDVVVTGVIAPLSQPTHFVNQQGFDYLSAMLPSGDTGLIAPASSGVTYALLPNGFGRGALQQRLDQLVKRRASADDRTFDRFELGSIDVSQIMELERAQAMFGRNGAPPVADILLILGAIVLGVSCLNYANLSAAQALALSKQIAMRRILGAGRMGILLQSWTQAALATTVALVLAGAGLWAAAPLLKVQTGVDIAAAIAGSPGALGLLGLLALTVTLVAGLYPALVLSHLRPVDALRAGKPGGTSKAAEQLFVGVQFALASVLLVAVTIISLQNSYMRGLAIPGGEDPAMLVMNVPGPVVDSLIHELATLPQVQGVTTGAGGGWNSISRADFVLTLKPGEPGHVIDWYPAGVGLFEFYGDKLLAGRSFSQALDSEPIQAPGSPPPIIPIVLDRAAAASLGETPAKVVGLRFCFPCQADIDANPARAAGPHPVDFEVIGVVENQPRHILKGDADGGIAYLYNVNPGGTFASPQDPRDIHVRLRADNVAAGLAAVRSEFERLAPNAPFKYQFEDDFFEQSFRPFEQISGLFAIVTALALLIAAVGLVGMAAQATQRRLHEVAVRKTLGSSTARVMGLLLADFSGPVIVANLIAWPFGYLMAQIYLARFAHRMPLTPWPFVLSMLGALAIAWLAVGGQTFKAASVRPAQVLRDA